MTINERVKAVRKHDRISLTMEKFGAKLGVKKSTISTIESGKNGVSNQLKTAIIREFHVNPEWLETGEGEMFAGKDRKHSIEALLATIAGAPEDSYIASVAEALSNLTENDWKELLCHMTWKMAEALRDKEVR